MLTFYTDGACLKNPGPGGWSFVLYNDNNDVVMEDSGGEVDTTNNRMELMGAICALEYCILMDVYQPMTTKKDLPDVKIITDSQYVKNGVTEWIHGWVKNNWRGSGGKAIKNQDLWQRMYELSSKMTVEWAWVKGHAGNIGNERADVLATTAAAEQKKILAANPHLAPVKPATTTIAATPAVSTPAPTQPVHSSDTNTNTTPSNRSYLKVPYAQKDDAKKLGARWDAEMKKWYCLPEQNAKFSRWL